MGYFIEIVDSRFNLSAASKKLLVSQPALSQIIKSFEKEKNVQLFERSRGRLRGLTPAGEVFYKHALTLTEIHKQMLEELRDTDASVKGRIKIGIPPLILCIALSDVISSMISDNPDIEFEIVEAGALELGKALVSNELDLAVLIHPTNISADVVNEFLLQESELAAFMSKVHPLALARKSGLDWSDLNNQHLAMFDNTFSMHHKLMERLSSLDIRPKKIIMTGSWAFLLTLAKKSDFITVFQSQIKNLFLLDDIAEIPFNDPIPWTLVICQTKKKRYNKVEKYVLNQILGHFS